MSNQIYRQRFSVPFEYAVCFTRGVFDPNNSTLADVLASREPERRHRMFVVVDSGVARGFPELPRAIATYCARHADRLELLETPTVIPGGEQVKQSPAIVEGLQEDMRRLGVDRQSYVVAIGGGAVLDAVGYAAATCHRGVRLIRLPTTVLSQNDSGIGVKTGINAFGAKNFLGTFTPPFAVINDADFLATLEARDLRAGMAEAVKVALIRDGELFRWLQEHVEGLRAFEPVAMAHMIRRAAEIHMQHIAGGGDPFEFGSARPLDFGHWVAHKLESLSSHQVRHGEAVAIGMVIDSFCSVEQGLLEPGALEAICDLLEALGFSLWHPALEQRDAQGEPELLDGLREFREHLGGELPVTMLRELGVGVEVHAVDAKHVARALAWLKAREGARDAAQ